MSDNVDVLWDAAEAEDSALVAKVSRWAAALLEAHDASSRSLSIVLCDDASISALNQSWRGIEGPTDVLSFPMDEGEALSAGEAAAPLGDIVISLETTAHQAPKHGYSYEEELRFLLIHGLCHLLGFDHGEPDEAAKMRAMEIKLLAVLDPDQARPDTPY